MSDGASHLAVWIGAISALGTLVAAIAAAYSAWTSKVSARAARDAVTEARQARREELAPKLVLEKDFLDLRFQWPHPASLNGEAVFLARKHWKDAAPAQPTFSLENYGQSPALEVTIVWELTDPHGAFKVPDQLQALGLSIQEGPGTTRDGAVIQSLMYSRSDGSGSALPLYHKWTTDIPSCSDRQKRTVEFPQHILNVLFIRGLQLGPTMPGDEMTLTATVSCYAVDEARYEREFCWKAVPFYHGEINPVVAYSHLFELPVHAKPSGSRVA